MFTHHWRPPPHCRGEFRWVDCHNGNSVPHDAVRAGKDKDGATLYVGRAYHEGDLLPAKVSPTHRCAYVPWGGGEHPKNQFQVLVSRHVAWEFSSGGRVPPEAMVVGNTSNGEPLYMGRALHEGTQTPGKVHPSHGCLYIPYNGKEVPYKEYEVLVMI